MRVRSFILNGAPLCHHAAVLKFATLRAHPCVSDSPALDDIGERITKPSHILPRAIGPAGRFCDKDPAMNETIGYPDPGLDLSDGFKPHTSHWGVFSARLREDQLEVRPYVGDPDPSGIIGNFP